MPRLAKFKKEEIIDAAFMLVKEESFSMLTARNLAKKLNSSSKVIFGYFTSMDELKKEVIKKAKELYGKYIKENIEKSDRPFLGVGIGYINFAADEASLFKLLFMSEKQTFPDLNTLLIDLDENYQLIIDSIKRTFFITDTNKALDIYHGMWILAHGMATLIATNVYKFTKDEIVNLFDSCLFGYLSYDELTKRVKERKK